MALRWTRVVSGFGAALLLSAAGCADGNSESSTGSKGGGEVFDTTRLRGTASTALLRASDCKDLLTQIQEDAIAKLATSVEAFRAADYGRAGGVGGGDGSVGFATGTSKTTPGVALGIPTQTTAPTPDVPGAVAEPTRDSAASTGNAAGPNISVSSDEDATSASSTNAQVVGIDEADFVKVVDNGKAMYLLHGSSLRKLKTYPPKDLAEQGTPLDIEGMPSEMFVTDSGIAVVFSNIYDQSVVFPATELCTPFACRGNYYGGTTKVTVADVSGATGKVLRELYYQGSYTSSRRYDDVVRVVLGASAPHGNIYEPVVELYDPFGNAYADEDVEAQLVAWQERTAEAVRRTTLANWIPPMREKKGGKLVELAPSCDTYFSPQPGIAEYGLTQVLSIDTKKPSADVGGITVLGATSTVYSNAERMVLAQPDVRYDFGYVPEERTALHVFDLAGSTTTYRASGWVPGMLPANNPQFGIDVAGDGVIRVGTTGSLRTKPDAKPFTDAFFQTKTDTRLRTLEVKPKSEELSVLGTSVALGHEGETLQSMRFVGDRAYAVTFRNTDPLIVLDVSDPSTLPVLGEIQIPGFSQYMQPLDDDHLVTFGQNGQGSSQLQLFDVSHPERGIPAPKVLSFGLGSYSAAAYDHKAFTYFADKSLIALPVYGSWYEPNSGRQRFASGLHVIHVDPATGFELKGVVDHGKLFAQQGCGICDTTGCYDFVCYNYGPEVRRGHFVSSDAGTYVYSFSYAGVIATDVDAFQDLATVRLPQPSSPWGGGSKGGIAVDVAVPPPPTAFPVSMGDSGGSTAPVAVDGGVAVTQ
jgi:hypothetical protein